MTGSIICATGEEACVDKLPDCASYTTRSCKPPYVQWAYKNCPYFCGFCRKYKVVYRDVTLVHFYIW